MGLIDTYDISNNNNYKYIYDDDDDDYVLFTDNYTNNLITQDNIDNINIINDITSDISENNIELFIDNEELLELQNNFEVIITNIKKNAYIEFDNKYMFYQGENPTKYKENFYNCYACNKHLVLNYKELPEFFKNNLETRVNKKNLILIYRLIQNSTYYVKYNFIDKFKQIIQDIKPLYLLTNSPEYNIIYDIYFNQQNIDYTEYIKCSYCTYLFCPKHQQIAKFKHFKCIGCKKNLDMCNWCKYLFEDNLCIDCKID